MAEVHLSAIRIGFPYTVEIDFPTGFHAEGEGVRTKFRRYVGDPDPIVPEDTRDGDVVTWELAESQTATMLPGTYIAEAEVYETATPEFRGVPLTNNRYIAECDYAPEE